MSVGKLLTVTTLACTCSLAFGSKPTIVSQTEKGVFTATGSSLLFKETESVNGTAAYYIDVDLGSARLDLTGDGASHASCLLSGKLKRWYTYISDDGCHFVELPSMPEPAQFFVCVENLLASGKEFLKDVYTIKDHMIDTKLGPITFGGEDVAGLHIEKDGGIRNVDFGGSLNILKVPFFLSQVDTTRQRQCLPSQMPRCSTSPLRGGSATRARTPSLTWPTSARPSRRG